MSNSSPGSTVSTTQVFCAVSTTSEHIRGLPAHPVLPFEIWDMILRMIWDDFRNCKSQDDLTHLWTSVRLVCKQFKAEVEDIVMTQHLSRTVLHFITDTFYVRYDTFSRSRAEIWALWNHTTLDHVQQHNFSIQLRFAGLLENEPRRAVFTMQHNPNDQNDPQTVYEGAIFRHMREKGGLGAIGNGDKYKPSDMRRIFGESEGWGPRSFPIPVFEPKTTEGMFVIQVRAGLNDCAVPGLKIDQDKREVSLDWIRLFSHFFRERRALDLHEGIDGGSAYPWQPAEQYPLYEQGPPFRGHPLLRNLDSTLTGLAIGDYRQLCELSHERENLYQLVRRLRDPVRTWRNNMGRFVGRERLSIGSLQLKRNCEREVNLDDEGEVVTKIADEQLLRLWEKVNDLMADRLACDTCRLKNKCCVRRWSFDIHGSLLGCTFCFMNNKLCTYQLAKRNQQLQSLPLASFRLASTSPAGQAFPSHDTSGLSALPLQRALGPMPTTQRKQRQRQQRQQLCLTHSTTADQSLVNAETAQISKIVPSSREKNTESIRTRESLPPAGSSHHKQPSSSKRYSLTAISRFMGHIPCAEAKTSREAEENMPTCAAEYNPFIPTDGLSCPFIHPYPIPHTTILCTLELISDFFILTIAAEDCGLTKTKIPNKDRMRQAMELCRLGKFIVTLERGNERYGSAKNIGSVRFQGDENIETGVIDRDVNSQEKSLNPRVEDVTDHQKSSSILRPSFEGEQQHDIDQNTDNVTTAIPSPPLRCPIHEERESGTAPDHHETMGVNETIYSPSAQGLQTPGSRGTYARTFRARQPLDQDRSFSSRLDAYFEKYNLKPIQRTNFATNASSPYTKDLLGKANVFVRKMDPPVPPQSLSSFKQQLAGPFGTHDRFNTFDERLRNDLVRSRVPLEDIQGLGDFTYQKRGEEQGTRVFSTMADILRRMFQIYHRGLQDLAAEIVPNKRDIEKRTANNDRKSDSGLIALKTSITKTETRKMRVWALNRIRADCYTGRFQRLHYEQNPSASLNLRLRAKVAPIAVGNANTTILDFSLMAITAPDHKNASTRPPIVANVTGIVEQPLYNSYMILKPARASLSTWFTSHMLKITVVVDLTLLVGDNNSYLHLILSIQGLPLLTATTTQNARNEDTQRDRASGYRRVLAHILPQDQEQLQSNGSGTLVGGNLVTCLSTLKPGPYSAQDPSPTHQLGRFPTSYSPTQPFGTQPAGSHADPFGYSCPSGLSHSPLPHCSSAFTCQLQYPHGTNLTQLDPLEVQIISYLFDAKHPELHYPSARSLQLAAKTAWNQGRIPFPASYSTIQRLASPRRQIHTDIPLSFPSHSVGGDMSIITPPSPSSIHHSCRSPARYSTAVGEGISCVRICVIKEDDEDGGGRAEHPIADTAPVTTTMATMKGAALEFLDIRKTVCMRDTASVTARALINALCLLKKVKRSAIQAAADLTSNELQGYLANPTSGGCDTVISVILNGDHTGNYAGYWMIYCRKHSTSISGSYSEGPRTLRSCGGTSQFLQRLHPILDSSSSGKLCFPREDRHSHLTHGLYLRMRYFAEQIKESVVTVKHVPCPKDDILNQREATNKINAQWGTLHKGPGPSGLVLLRMKLFRYQYFSDMNFTVIDREEIPKLMALRTTIDSRSACGPRDLENRSLNHSIHKKQCKAGHESQEHQIQIPYHAAPVTPTILSSTILTLGEFKLCNRGLRGAKLLGKRSACPDTPCDVWEADGLLISCSMQTMASTQQQGIDKETVNRQLHHKGEALSKDDKIEGGEDNHNVAEDRKQAAAEAATTQDIINIGINVVLWTTGAAQTEASGDSVEVSLGWQSEEDSALSIRFQIQINTLADMEQIGLTSPFVNAFMKILTELWRQAIYVLDHTAQGKWY